MLRLATVRSASVAVLAGALASCSGATPSLLSALSPTPGVEETKSKTAASQDKPTDKPGCKTTQTCTVVLRKLVTNPNRAWIGKPQPPSGYDDGTRLFAYRALRPQMSCAELGRAVDETRSAMRDKEGASHASSRALMTQVNAELRSERQRRCKATAKVASP